MSTQQPRFIRVNADVYELQEETVPKPATDKYFVAQAVADLTKAQDKFVAGVESLLPSAAKTSFELLEEPLKSLLSPVTTVTTNLRSMPRTFKFDTPSEQFYAFEAQRWGQIDYLLSMAVQLTQNDIGEGMIDGLLKAQKSMSVLKDRHQKVFDAAHKNETRTVTADFDPDATQPVKVEREQEAKQLKKAPEAKQLSAVDLHQRELVSAISNLLTAAKAIATATVSTLSQYDDAAEAIASAHAHIKSDQMSGVKFAQTVKYAGVTYRRV